MKSTGTIQAGTGLWVSPNAEATNSCGFTGVPGGVRYGNGSFDVLSFTGYWWSSTERDAATAWSRPLNYGSGGHGRIFNNKGNGYSVRCVKD